MILSKRPMNNDMKESAEKGERRREGGDQRSGSAMEPDTLADIGTDKKESFNAQKLANLPESVFNRWPKRKRRPRLDSCVDNLELNSRAANALYYAGIKTIGDLLRHSRCDLLGLWNCGPATLAVIERAVRKAKFRWNQNP
jgi:DNA-directed RNA polymerase alpha subunit